MPLNIRRKTQSRSQSCALSYSNTNNNITLKPQLGSLSRNINKFDFSSQAAKGDSAIMPSNLADPPRAVATLQRSRNRGMKRQRINQAMDFRHVNSRCLQYYCDHSWLSARICRWCLAGVMHFCYSRGWVNGIPLHLEHPGKSGQSITLNAQQFGCRYTSADPIKGA